MAAYAQTTTLDTPHTERISRNLGIISGKCDITNYNQTGVEITDITDHFKTLFRVLVDGASDEGHICRWNTTDKCFHAFNTKQKPTLVVEEVVTVVAGTGIGALAHTPFYIMAVQVTAGSTTGYFSIIPTGETTATKQVAVNFTTGALLFRIADAVTSVKITYIPLQVTGPFVEGNRVIDESVTAAAAKTDLANQACALQYVWDDTDSNIVTFEPVGEAPSATHVCVVDIDDGSDDTNIDSHADDEGNTLKVTYIKYSALPPNLCIGDGDLSLTSEAYQFTVTAGYQGTVIPGLGVHLCGEETGSGNELGIWGGPSATAANGVGEWDPQINYILTNNTNAIVTLAMPWFIISEIESLNVYGGEVGDDVDVGEVNFIAIGLV